MRLAGRLIASWIDHHRIEVAGLAAILVRHLVGFSTLVLHVDPPVFTDADTLALWMAAMVRPQRRGTAERGTWNQDGAS